MSLAVVYHKTDNGSSGTGGESFYVTTERHCGNGKDLYKSLSSETKSATSFWRFRFVPTKHSYQVSQLYLSDNDK